MLRCVKCGTEIKRTWEYCPMCGQKLSDTKKCMTCKCKDWNIPAGVDIKQGYFYCGNMDKQQVMRGDPNKMGCWRWSNK